MSYNILADSYKGHFERDVPETYLSFEYRSKIILAELKQIKPDIVFLQEVDHYQKRYQQPLIELGYDIYYLHRKDKPDGNAVGYRTDKFTLQGKHFLDFDKDHPYTKYDEYKQGNGAIFLSLKHIETGKSINVLGTHFFWDPRKEHIKFVQMYIIMNFLSANLGKDDIIIWGGDLNSKPQDNLILYITDRMMPKLDRMNT